MFINLVLRSSSPRSCRVDDLYVNFDEREKNEMSFVRFLFSDANSYSASATKRYSIVVNVDRNLLGSVIVKERRRFLE